MSGARNRGGRSRGELIRRRAQAHFVGRRAQLTLFVENLGKDPQDEADPAEFLFHVRGVGGIGKSTLVRQWQERARSAGAVTAVVDESDVHGVPQALAELVRQVAEQTGALKEFDRAAEQYRREQEAAAEPVPVDGMVAGGEPSMSSRVVSQAALGAASLIPGVGVVTAMANPDAAAQGLDRLRSGVQARGRRGRGGDTDGLSRAFVAELGKVCGRHPWVVLFFDTWEQTSRYLDGWVRELLEDGFGPVPANVIVVLAGRDELPEREWAPLRALVADVPLEVFTEAETRALLAARGVTAPEAVEAVLQLSMGLPLLVDLLAHTRPGTAEDVDAGADAVDAAVERFVQWITDPHQRETVLACALPPRLNEDVFTAAAPQEAGRLWEWLCGQPFVSGHGGFKQYHAVVRASMLRRQRLHAPQRWATAHLRLADAHAAWRTTAEHDLPDDKRWSDARWLRHRLDETYHRLCAQPAAELHQALEQAVHAAGQDTAALRQWVDVLEQAARDTDEPALRAWADRLQNAVTGDEPALACLSALLTHGRLDTTTRAWCHTYRGEHLYLLDHDEEALAELDQAITVDPGNACAWAHRGEVHRWLKHLDQAIADLNTALDIDPAYAWALAQRGETHRLAGRYDQAITDLNAALDIDPAYAWALGSRGEAHRQTGRYDQAIADLNAALDIDPAYAWALTQRGETHRLAGRYDQAITDFTAALDIDPAYAWALGSRGQALIRTDRYDEAVADLNAALRVDPADPWALAQRGEAHRLADRYDQAITDLNAALDIDPAYAWALGSRGQAHRQAGRYDRAITDFTAALDIDPAYAWALAQRGQAHRQAGRYDQAITDFTAALRIDPADPWALAQRGEAHRLAGRYDQAITDFTNALQHAPTDAWIIGSRGQALIGAGRHDQAIEDLTTALQHDPTLTWALTARGEAHRMAGHYNEAVTDFTNALQHAPTDAWLIAHRGETHRQAGRYDQAIGDFTSALEHDPTDTWALTQRGIARRQAGDRVGARKDLERAIAFRPEEPDVLFEKTVLDTMESGFAACREQWAELLTFQPQTSDGDATRYFALFRVLLLERDSDVVEATAVFLSGVPDHDAVTDLLHYLAELSALGGEPADRARQCRQLVEEWERPGTDGVGGVCLPS
jgi:tetratricopeptide (TPR) repeat protein